jgi:general secretion pathway protein I
MSNNGPTIWSRGFTLIEVLIALAVFAISAMAVMSQVGNSISQLQKLKEKNAAAIVAENQLNRIRSADQWPPLGINTEQVEFNQLRWLVKTEVTSTSDPWLRKLEVSIEQEDYGQEANVVYRLIAYRGKY